jgi:hypothetical protein
VPPRAEITSWLSDVYGRPMYFGEDDGSGAWVGEHPLGENPSRRGDGQPETDADARFFDARENGYTGWIDQDGYQVPDVDAWIADRQRADLPVIDAELIDPEGEVGYLEPPSAYTDVREPTPVTATPHTTGGSFMTAPAEHGLTAYQNYAAQLQNSCGDAVSSIETTVASLQNDEFSGDAVAGFQEAGEYFEAAKAAVAKSMAALDRANTVKDAYLAEQGAGNKTALMAE